MDIFWLTGSECVGRRNLENKNGGRPRQKTKQSVGRGWSAESKMFQKRSEASGRYKSDV